jgi:hypothetical protein
VGAVAGLVVGVLVGHLDLAGHGPDAVADKVVAADDLEALADAAAELITLETREMLVVDS